MTNDLSTIPGDLQKALFTLVDVDIVTGDIVEVMKEILEVMNSKDARQITRLSPRIKVLLESTQKVHLDVQQALALSRRSKFSNSLKSRKLSEERTAHKREAKLAGTWEAENATVGKKSESLRRLENVMKTQAKDQTLKKMPASKKRSSNSTPAKRSAKKSKLSRMLFLPHGLPAPRNGEVYSVREVVVFMRVNTNSPLFKQSSLSVYNVLANREPLPPLLICGYRTLHRSVKNYEDNGELPKESDEGIRVGRPPLISPEQVPLLNEGVKEHSGKVEKMSDLSNTIVAIASKSDQEQIEPPSADTQLFYNLIAANEPGITLTKASSARPQGCRRQMAASSLRNLMSQCCTVLEVQFVPGRFDAPQNLSTGASFMLKTLKAVTGVDHQPIKDWQAVNFDFSSYYAWEGVAPDDRSADQWLRVVACVSCKRSSRRDFHLG